MKFRIGQGFDVHAFVEGRPLILCGVNVPHTHGLLGHSDADVATHALMDALLGALALGDIGKHFPDKDPQYKGIDSLKLLAHVVELIQNKNFQIENVDITLIMQTPKVAPFILTMREKMASVLQTSLENVSVKATTTEQLGFTGRKEGVAAQAIALVSQIRKSIPC